MNILYILIELILVNMNQTVPIHMAIKKNYCSILIHNKYYYVES